MINLLSVISKEQDRLKAEGYNPIMVSMNSWTRQMFNKECENRLGRICKTIYGMQIREDISLPDGKIRMDVSGDSAKEFAW